MINRIILVQRKFSIYTQFLDTILQSEDVIQEGETRNDALKRVHRELEATAAELRKEANPESTALSASLYVHPPEYPFKHERIGEINLQDVRAKEELEDKILAASSLEELAKLKEEASNHGLKGNYMKKVNELMAK